MIPNRLQSLRQEMKKRGIDVYIVPTSDFHESEYVGEYFKARKFITGFTGSAGTAVITMTEAGLWTDGRYFIQAEKQLEGTTVTLFRMGQEGVPTVSEYLKTNLPQGGTIGFDGRVMNTMLGKEFLNIAKDKGGKLYTSEDLIDLIWTDRPALPAEKTYVLEEKYSGESCKHVTRFFAALRAKNFYRYSLFTYLIHCAQRPSHHPSVQVPSYGHGMNSQRCSPCPHRPTSCDHGLHA